ncbi:hypothetical protein CPB97_007565, partial [Podila verticillata]
MVHAADPDYLPIKQQEGAPCKTTKDCIYQDYHRCNEKAGCQPFAGSLRSPCDNDVDCQFGLSCNQDMNAKPNITAYFNAGGQGQLDIPFLKRCYMVLDPSLRRVNPEKGNPDNGVTACSDDDDCPNKNCHWGVCITQA